MEKNVTNKVAVNFSDREVDKKLSHHILLLLKKQQEQTNRPTVFLCIGSDRYTGDCLGPLTGTYLEENCIGNVFGTLDRPVHAGNLVDTIKIIKEKFRQPIIIAVDACLGKVSEIGNIEAWEGGVEAGIAVGNRLPCIGDISIIGVVNAGGQFGYLDLQSTPLATVVKLSKIIGSALATSLQTLASQDAAAGLKS
jgi:putative sporulation protein YyaC